MKRRIIFLTGKGDIPTSVRVMKAGAIDFLTKPVKNRDLLQAIARAKFYHALLQDGLTSRSPVIWGTVKRTIKVHRARVMEKLRLRTVANLVRFAERAGIVVAKPLGQLDRQMITFDIPAHAP
jgi:FixJ family two-component response regulator